MPFNLWLKEPEPESSEPPRYVLPNHFHFQRHFIHHLFDSYYNQTLSSSTPSSHEPMSLTLFTYQKIVRDYMNFHTPYRGILLYHGLGVGKTLSAIAIAECNRVMSTNPSTTKILVFLPASLDTNFRTNLKKFGIFDISPSSYWKPRKSSHTSSSWKYYSTNHENRPPSNDSFLCGTNRTTQQERPIPLFDFQQWVKTTPRDPRGIPFRDLSFDDQTTILQETESVIHELYDICHYNGIQVHDIRRTYTHEYLQNKIIIIDEIHNFISRAKSSEKGPCGLLYDLFLNHPTVKIIALSGTPIVNHPFELAMLVNLLKGKMTVYQLSMPQRPFLSLPSMETLLKRHDNINDIVIDEQKECIYITLLPPSSRIQNRTMGYVTSQVPTRALSLDVSSGWVELDRGKYKCSLKEIKTVFFPWKEGEHSIFHSTFLSIDSENRSLVLKNIDLLQSALVGLISYYKPQSEDYPESSETTKYIPMSSYQCEIYLKERQKEIAQESTRRQEDDHGNNYRYATRSICNFVFPFDRKFNKRELNDHTEEEKEGEQQSSKPPLPTRSKQFEDTKKQYKHRLSEILNDHSTQKKQFLRTYSPKFKEIIRELTMEGKNVIYSFFKTLEGIDILAMILTSLFNWIEIEVELRGSTWTVKNKDMVMNPVYRGKRFIRFTGDIPEDNRIALLTLYRHSTAHQADTQRLFGSSATATFPSNVHGKFINLIFLSMAGAEGIELSNVRKVHIMESYWNPVKIEQVIGRAIRFKSHDELDMKKRHVDIIYYISTFPSDLDTSSIRHETFTSDQTVLGIMNRKKQFNTQISHLLQRVAIDCKANRPLTQRKNSPNYHCYQPLTSTSYFPLLYQ